MKSLIFAPMIALWAATIPARAQGLQIGEVLIVCSLSPGDNQGQSLEGSLKTSIPKWNASIPGTQTQIFKADRGSDKGKTLLVCAVQSQAVRNKLPADPFTSPAFTLNARPLSESVGRATEYHLIGPEDFKNLPTVSLLGMHYIKVRPGRAAAFEQFVRERLHPAVGKLLPDMQLLYYKGIGNDAVSYVTIFAIGSPAARDKYWPAGAPETEVLKAAFKSQEDLAEELGSFLVEGSYLPPGGGAAAYFESREWTDYVMEEP